MNKKKNKHVNFYNVICLRIISRSNYLNFIYPDLIRALACTNISHLMGLVRLKHAHAQRLVRKTVPYTPHKQANQVGLLTMRL